jgi:hypothetical protein
MRARTSGKLQSPAVTHDVPVVVLSEHATVVKRQPVPDGQHRSIHTQVTELTSRIKQQARAG